MLYNKSYHLGFLDSVLRTKGMKVFKDKVFCFLFLYGYDNIYIKLEEWLGKQGEEIEL